MASAPRTHFLRRALLLGLLAVVCTAPARAARAPAPRAPVVTMLGDSITAGLGLPAAAALPAQLQAALAARGVKAVVRGAGVSGDTTGGGLARLDFSVQSDTAVCVVALGGNDLLQGQDPVTSRRNLDQIVARLQARHIGVVLAGLKAPPQLGRRYAAQFDAIFTSVAHAHRAPLYPDLRAGVAGNASLIQGDGLHPNAAGVKVIAAGLAPLVVRALRTHR